MSKATTYEQLNDTALRAQGYAADVAAAAAQAIGALDEAKVNKRAAIYCVLADSGWIEAEPDGEDETGLRYPFYYDITAAVTAADRADMCIETGSLYYAAMCGFCPAVETLAGAIRVRAQQRPEGTIRAQCWITEGVTQ